MSPVLVTGGNGYLATRLVADLLHAGTEVRATVRSWDNEPELRQAVRRGGADDAGLQVVVASLTADDGWAERPGDQTQDLHRPRPGHARRSFAQAARGSPLRPAR